MVDLKYYPPRCEYMVEGNHLISLGDIRTKVSGTTMATILGMSPWSTPFQAACSLLGLCRPDISDKPAVKVGVALEGRIITYLDETYKSKGTFLPAEEVYVKREGDHDSWVSDFQDDYFSGHVDGIVMTDGGEDYILEIKTTGNPESWKNGVPVNYYWQIALYNEFISKKDMAFVGLGIVNQNTYKDPESWVPNVNTVGLFEMPIDRDDVVIKMQEVREWYDKYVAKGITPDYGPTNEGDVMMFEHLKSLNSTIEEMQGLLDEYWDTESQIRSRTFQVKDMEHSRDDIKKRIKDYMDVHNLTLLISDRGVCNATLTTTTRKDYDYKQMAKDGIDIERYAITTETKTIKFKETR